MKVTVPGKTPMDRLANLTKRVVAVPKDEVEREEQRWRKERARLSYSKTKRSVT